MNCPNCHQSFEKPSGGQIPYPCPHCQSNVLGVYCELTHIGGGAMGDVYKAFRPDMGRRTVAIKLPKQAEARVCHRFEREIAASARLQHENIVRAFDRGEEDGRPYLVLEYVAGRVLSDLVDAEYPLAAAEVARILRQVAAGLAHAAQHKIVNRDIKPDNILIASDGTAKILDYGLALIDDLDGSADRVTRNGTLLGTPGFLAPEQAIDPRGVSIAADVYALGCTAHYMLTRRPPFTAKDSFGMLKQHASAPRPSVRAKRPDVEESLDQLIQRMMAVSPDDRPSPRELVQQLDKLIPALNAARPSMPAPTVGMIDVRCPGCQQVFHLKSDMVGKKMRCPNKLCRKTFTVEPQLGATMSFAPPADNATVRDGIAASFAAEPMDAEVMDAEPVEAEAMEAEVMEAEAVEAEPIEAEDFEPPPIQDPQFPDPQIAEAEPLEAETWHESPAPEIAEAELLPPVQVAEATADDIADAEPVTDTPADELETVQASAVNIETPREGPLEIATAAAIAPPPAPAPVPSSPAPAQSSPAPAPKPKPQPKPLTKAQQRARKIRLVSLSLLGVCVLAGAGLWYFWPKPKTPEERWADVQKLYREDRQWTKAKKELKRFEADFPADVHVAEIPYFLAMCDVGDLIYSDAFRGRRQEALAAAKKIFAEHRDNPAYEAYSDDLFAALKLLVEHFTSEAAASAAKSPSLDKIALARQTHDLLKTVGESVKAEDAASTVQSLDQQIVQTETIVREGLARLEALADLKSAQSNEPIADINGLYAKVDGLLASFPKLAADKELLDLKKQAFLAEKDRVRYKPYNEEDDPVPVATTAKSSAQNLFIVWDGRQGSPPPIRRRQVLCTISRGVLYVFDPQGNFLWARRMGIDTSRLPLHVPATATSPDALVTVSTEDNTLFSLEAENQRVLWQYKAGGDISSPLTVVDVPGGRNQPDKKRGLLPTTDGNTGYINVLELVMGKQLGRFEIDQPLAPVGGGYDKNNRVAYFPADSQRVFAINPLAIDNPDKEPACKAVLFTQHASGALRSEPTLVDRGTTGSPEVYLIMAEASELEQMKLRVFDLNATRLKDPHSPPIKETPVDGWSWFSPLATPDRITLVTDSGALGVLGLNLDNTSEALYWVIKPEAAKLPVRDRFRSLAVDSDERYLWVMAGGSLQKLKLDVLGQQTRRVWPAEGQTPEVTGVPLHEAQLDERGEVLFLGLMAADGGHFDFLAVDSRQGHKLWQRQLGVKLFGDPLPVGKQVLVIDHSGRTLLLDPEKSETVYQPSSEFALPEGGDPQKIIRIRSDKGTPYLALPLADGKQLALAHLDGSQDGPLVWEIFPLAEALQGRPCICGDFLVVPGAEGTLRRRSLKADVKVPINEQPVDWMPGPIGVSKKPGPQRAEIFPLGKESILLVAARRDVRSMQIREVANVTSWRQVGGAFESEAPLIGQVLVYRDRALVVDENGKVYAFNGTDPGESRGEWSLGGKPTGDPFLRGDKLLAVVDGRKLVAVSPDEPNETGEPLWTGEPLAGRIRGQPVVSGDVLLVTDESRRVTALNLADGKVAWTVRLPARIGPCAAAVPFGDDRILVPLSDGTFQVLPRPSPQPSESSQ